MSRFVIGDIHGMYNKMIKALKLSGFDPRKDILYGVGDFCDRGPNSFEVVEYLMSLGDRFKSVFGNHDFWLWQFLQLDVKYVKSDDVKQHMMLDSYYYNVTNDGSFVYWTSNYMSSYVIDCWLYNGGGETINSFAKASSKQFTDMFKWLSRMPYRIELDNFVIQHTPCVRIKDFFPDGNYSVTMQDLVNKHICSRGYDSMLWDRSFIEYSKAVNEDAPDISTSIYRVITDKTMIIGHTPTPYRNLKAVPVYDKDLNFILIDTGSFITKNEYNTSSWDGAVTVLNLDTLDWVTSKEEYGTITRKLFEKHGAEE